tara:strand:- start:1051 stop:1449 length:399 start_codon:yes stop_codon:yes gene_type:complete
MATTTATITLNSTDLLTDELGLSTTSELYNGPNFSTGLSRMKVVATAVHSTATTIYTADDFAAIAYLYVKNTDTTATNYIFVYNDTTSGDPVILKLAGGDWAFMPLIADKTLKAYATTNPTTIEFMVIGTDQ